MTDVVIVSDKRTDLQQSPGGDDALVKVVFSSPANVTPTVVPATSYNNSLINFSLYSPGLKNIIERCLRLRMTVRFQCSVDGDFPNAAFEQFFDAPKQFPIMNSILQLQLSINGTNISFQPYELLLPLLTYNNDPTFRSKNWSESTAMPDTYQDYSDGLQHYGTARDPLSPFGAVSSENSRGGFSYIEVDARTRDYTFTEPLMISPLALKIGETGLCNINSIQIQLTMVPNLFYRMWAHALGGSHDYNIATATATILTAPTILYDVLTPSALNASRIPASLSYEYVNYKQYFRSFTTGTLPAAPAVGTPGAAVVVQSDSLRLNSIPRAVYLFFRRPKDSVTSYQSDTYCYISNISILFNNSALLLQTAQPQDLYQIAVRNGFNKSWLEWSKISGSVLRLEFGRDIPVPEGTAPNSNAYTTLQISATVQSLSVTEEPWDFYQVIASEGSAIISADKFSTSYGELTTEDVLRAEVQDVKLSEEEYQLHEVKNDVFGGGRKHMKRLKCFKSSVIGKIRGNLKDASDLLKKSKTRGGALLPASAAAGKALEDIYVSNNDDGIGGGYSAGSMPAYANRRR